MQRVVWGVDYALPIRARSARYDLKTDVIVVELTNGQWFAFDPRQFKQLVSVPRAILASVEVCASGETLRWRSLGEHLKVLNLLIDVVSRARATLKGRNSGVCS